MLKIVYTRSKEAAIMIEQKIPIGISDFGEIRANGYYYIDKTGLILELLKTKSTKVTLFTRPRRFGKTLGISMLAHFFDIRKNSSTLFENLEITGHPEICSVWMNQWPTLYLTFKDIDGLDYEAAKGMLRNRISQLCKEHLYLEKSEKVNEYDRKVFSQLADIVDGRVTDDQLKTSLALLMSMMQAHYGKPIILLLDEYDVPLAKADSHGYYPQMLEIIKAMMSTSLKDNTSLKFAVITGCLRISKESIFTGTNHFTVDTISGSRYNEYFGFTHQEVETFLVDTNCREYQEKIRKWYNGYRFGNLDIYCPWDVMNYVNRAITEGIQEPENFWENTSDNGIIRSFLERTDFDITEKFETLLNGGYIKETITENQTYNFLMSSEENLWSLLYLTGYLTQARPEEITPGDCLAKKQLALKIPNAEVLEIFQKSVIEWTGESISQIGRQNLFQAMWAGESEKLTEQISDLLFGTISFHDYAESFYHAFLAGLLANSGYAVESNDEQGLGRPDIVIKDRKKRRAAVIEIKIAKLQENLPWECQKALGQIKEKQYDKKIRQRGFKSVFCYGIAFCQKSCLVKKDKECAGR